MTLADLLERLGGVPLERIRLDPPLGTATEQDVIDLHDREDRLFELVDGVLVEKAMGYLESVLATCISQLLRNYMSEKRLGIVAGADGMMRLAKGLVRIPDVSVVLWERLPDHKGPRQPIPHLAPDLAVEGLSASNTEAEIDRKLTEYIASRCHCAWIVDPIEKSVRIYE